MMRQIVILAVVLCFGTAAVTAAPPRKAGTGAAAAGLAARAGDGDDGDNVRLKTKTIVQLTALPISKAECPWIEANGTVCGKACQLRTCQAFAAIYKASNNLTDPWDNEKGWEKTTHIPCEKLIAGTPRQAVYCSWFGVTCCTPSGMASNSCSAVNTVVALELTINNINVSLQNPALLPNLKMLHGCGLRILNLEANNIIGTFTDEWGELNKLTVFNFGNCWVYGTLPDGLRRLSNLTLINLSNNWLNGTLPSWLADMKQLRVLNLGSNQGANEGGNSSEPALGLLGSIPPQIGDLTKLRELNLEANSLSGELPESLCSGDNSTLLLLNVRGNQLEADAKGVTSCGNLVQLDISQNKFTGSLPASTDWDELATYRAGSNQFSGRFPLKLTTARILEHLDISNNRLTGIIPPQVTLLSSLKTFVVSSNKFSGTVTENIYYLPALAKLDLSNNTLVGTTPVAIGLAYGLSEMDISNNPGLTGVLPPQMGLLSRLKQVRTTNTSVSCAGIIEPYTITTNNSCSDPDRCLTPFTFGNNDTRYQHCGKEELLPCFLRFSEYMVPRDDDSNMRCKYLVRRPLDDAKALCAGTGNMTLGQQSSQLPDVGTDRVQQLWHVDPSYYQYQACECLLGYRAIWEANGTVLRCVPAGHQAPTAIIVGVVAAAAVLIIALLAWWQYLTTRPRWLRERILQAKRSRGAPKATKPGDKVTVSIAVTDVKDFSDLTRQYPDLMNKAMGIHNNILRKASHNHAGYIMDQEGDSWTVAFHDAEDAVAFSLQVQQALALRSWGKLRVASHHELSDLATMRDGVFSARFSHTHQSSINSAAVRHSSSSLGLMGEDSYSTHGGALVGNTAGLCMDSFIAGQHLERGSKANTSFTSSGGHPSSADRSFTLPRRGSDDVPAHCVNAAVSGGPMSNGPSRGGQGISSSAAAAAATSAAGNKQQSSGGGNGGGNSLHQQHSHHHPDQRQVSFSDATMGRDASPFLRQQQPLIRLMRSNSEEHLVQPSGQSGDSWPDDQFSPGSGAMMKNARVADSFDSRARPESLMNNSMSITAASRGRSSGSGSRLWNAGAEMMRRFSVFGRSALLSSGVQTPRDAPPHHTLHLSVRIGIATGSLPYGSDLNSCSVKDRAKSCVSEVANGGQILLDENTFKAIKDSLSVLGTVNEAGYDDRQLQQLLHSRVVNRLQHHMCCNSCACAFCRSSQRDASFTSQALMRDIQDYDNDALVVHMGAFEPPSDTQYQRNRAKKQPDAQGTSDSSSPSTPASGAGEDGAGPLANKDVAAAADAAMEAPAPAAAAGETKKLEADGKGSGRHNAITTRRPKLLHLYAVAAPGMRRVPTSTRDIAQCLSWAAPVELKRRWSKVQKGYFDAPGARSIDLAPSAQGGYQAALPEVVIVFAQVVGATSFSYKRNRGDTHALKKAVTRCMLQMLDELPETDEGRDGYLCRCQEADLKYMISFKAAHMALQWCMLVQEALMYFNWPDSILAHPGFEEVLDPMTGLPLFRGPRLRMGFAVGQPNSVLPDHTGRANYYGHSVNRAARFMEAAAHGGQIVTDVDTARKLFQQWHRECVVQDGAESTPSRAHSDADVQPMLTDGRYELPNDAALMQALVSRSLSETTGHCRPSAARLPLSRLAMRQQHQNSWLQQLHQSQLQAREARQLQLSVLGPISSREGSNSSPLPDTLIKSAMQPLPQIQGTPGSSFTTSQQQLRPLAVQDSGPSFTRRSLMAGASGGSFSRQQVAGSGGSFTRQQVAGSGGSFTRQQLTPSGGSFTRRQQLAVSPRGALTPRQQGTSMSASFSARRNIAPAPAAGAGAGAAGPQAVVMQSGHSFVLQLPPNWQSTDTEDVVERVTASYLGTFSFKGSGVFEMVNILPSSLLGRQFPEDAPKGKGYRVMVSEGPVAGLDPVVFSLPARIIAAREAFRVASASKAEAKQRGS